MPTTNAAIPMQILKPLPTQPAASAAVPETTLKRSKSLPSRSSVAPDFVPRAQSLTALHKTAGSGGDVPQPGATGLSEDTVNAFLKKAGLDIALRENRLFITRHRDPEAAEAQRPPSGKDLARVCHALMVAEETPAKLDAARTLLPAINAQLLEHIEADQSETSMKDKVMALAKSYCTVLGGRDLAIDDVIGTINTYFFDRIGDDKALNSSNIAAAALTSLLMLTPTVGKNLPLIADAIREGRYRDAIMPAFSICAVSAMTLNPTMAAFGLDRASAIAAATGNALMAANLLDIQHDGREWASLKREHVDPESRPFTSFARNQGLVDKGLHTALDFLHEFGAQMGFLALNVKNAVAAGESTRNPAAFPLLGVLLGSFLLDTARGEQPFAEFKADRKALAGEISVDTNDARAQAARTFLQQKISETYDSDYGLLMRPLLNRPAGSHAARQFGGNTLSDTEEKTFLKGLIGRFCTRWEAENAAHVAIDRIYRFDRFDPAENMGDDRAVGEILRFVQAERNKDKALMLDTRGLAHADHVYRSIIAHAIKCATFEELGR